MNEEDFVANVVAIAFITVAAIDDDDKDVDNECKANDDYVGKHPVLTLSSVRMHYSYMYVPASVQKVLSDFGDKYQGLQ